jgi:AraC-like DNA-binding protein
VKLGKTATETLQLLRDAYGDEALSWARVFGWHRRFVLGMMSMEDDTRSGRPSSSRNEDNVIRIRDMKREDRTVTVRMLADALHISKSTCHQILRENLGKQKLKASLVPHALTQDQKEVRASICADLLHEAQNNAMFINSIIADDESWCFQYDPQTKRQSAEWRSTCRPSKKVRRQLSTTKTMIIVLFDARGIVHH